MATCITKARSNYFSVTDVPAFLTMMQKWEKDFGIRIMKKESMRIKPYMHSVTKQRASISTVLFVISRRFCQNGKRLSFRKLLTSSR